MKAIRYFLLSCMVMTIGCAGAQPEPLPQLTEEELLEVLRSRLAEVRAAAPEGIESFPPDLDLSPLVGMTETQVLAALGEPMICGEPPRVCTSHGEAMIIGYSFYRLPEESRGGGTELILSIDATRTISDARWLQTQ